MRSTRHHGPAPTRAPRPDVGDQVRHYGRLWRVTESHPLDAGGWWAMIEGVDHDWRSQIDHYTRGVELVHVAPAKPPAPESPGLVAALDAYHAALARLPPVEHGVVVEHPPATPAPVAEEAPRPDPDAEGRYRRDAGWTRGD